jgi:hypothetical protein
MKFTWSLVVAESLGLLRGWSAISEYYYGTPTRHRAVRKLVGTGAPIFFLGDVPHARPDALSRDILERERKAAASAEPAPAALIES